MHFDRIFLSLALIGGALASVAVAESVYKCTDKDGAVVYQKQRCEDARQSEEKNLNPDNNVIKSELPPLSSPPSNANSDSSPAKPATAAPARPTNRRPRMGY